LDSVLQLSSNIKKNIISILQLSTKKRLLHTLIEKILLATIQK